MEGDSWIGTNSLIDAKKLHALGVVTFNWNLAEFSLFWLFNAVSEMDIMKSRILIHDMQTPTLQKKILELSAESLALEQGEKDCIEFGIKALEVCRQNRNQFTHYLPSKGKEGLELYRNKGPALSYDIIPSDITIIRRVAEEILQTYKFITTLSTRIRDRLNAGPPNRLGALIKPAPLPDIFPLPEMVWKPPIPPRQPSRKKQK